MIYGRCYNCKYKKFFVRQRQVKLPNGLVAHSREAICKKCLQALQDKVKNQHE